MNRKRLKITTDEENPLDEINITPLVDVSFTILIIFILIAPSIEQGINIKVPKASSKKIEAKQSLIVELDKKGRLYLEGERITKETLSKILQPLALSKKNATVFLKADESNNYGKIIDIIDIIKTSGIENVGLITREKRNGR